MENQKSPELRFNGFNENWEQSNFLDNIQSIIDFRGRTPKKLGMDWSKDGYLALSALNVKNGYIDPKIDAHYGDEKLYQKWMAGNELKKGQVLFTTEAPMGNVAQVPDDRGYILSQRTIAFNVKANKISDDFLAVLLGSPNVFNTLSGLSSGGTAKGVSQKSLSGLEVIFAQDLAEQEQIGEFFQNLDQSIALHEKKLAQTQNFKKAMLEKMFPKHGSKRPEIRLKGFSGDWDQHELGQHSEMFNGDRGVNYPSSDDMVKVGIPFINAGDLEDGRVNLQNANKITRYKYNQLNGAKIKFGDIVYCLRGTLGKNAFIDNFNEGTVASSLVVIRPKNILGAYLFQVLNTDIEFRQRTLCDEGAAQPNLSAKNLAGFMIPVPSIEEQKAIGCFFNKLDETLNLQQQQLQTLKNLKQAFLEKMFV